MRKIGFGFLAASASAIAIAATPAEAQSPETAEIVKIMRANAGNPKWRPSGAKGQCFMGAYTPTADAAKLTSSLGFTQPNRVIVRLSVGGGNPKVPDATKTVNRGLSLRFDPGGKGETEFVTVNAPVNFVKSPAQMLAFLQARLPGADGKPDPEKIKAFTEANPETTNQGKFLASLPVAGSWVGVNYWAVHNYTFTNAQGQKQLVKFKFEPLAGVVALTDDEAKAKPADYLVDELKGRIAAKQPAGFNVVAIIGGRPGDEVINPTQRWADEDSRPTVTLGRIDITALEDNKTCDGQIFDPLNLAKGLEGPANDPLFQARQPAYAVSISERL
ncbi:MAG: hypothetical protein RL291_1854 [Pseudomonadota bacterium]|jgi:catalase